MGENETCKTCIWGQDENVNNDASPPIKGRKCRRKPPVVTGGMMSSVQTIWPLVLDADFCGDWQGNPTWPETPF